MAVPQPGMLKIAGVIFALLALAPLLRLILGLDVRIGSYLVPRYLSALAFIILGFLAYWYFKASRS